MLASQCRAHRALGLNCSAASRRRAVQARAASEQATETYSVSLAKPIGVRFARGNDGAAYVFEADEALGSSDDRLQPGDKVVKVSASFGDDIWDAKNFGQVMYAMKTRNGDVYMELIDRGGDMSCFEEIERTEAQKQWEAERAGGNYGAGTKEIQTRNYIAAKEAARKRTEVFNDALEEFRSGKVEDALQMFEEVKGMEPKTSQISRERDFARVSNVYRVTLYNIACCYSTLKQADAAVEAIEEAMFCGFEEFQKIRTDKNLEYMRQSDKFEGTMKKYDEGVINEQAINAIKGLFGWGKKK